MKTRCSRPEPGAAPARASQATSGTRSCVAPEAITTAPAVAPKRAARAPRAVSSPLRPMDDYAVLEPIGEGSFGKVRPCGCCH
jgi:hypothetical protein